MSNSARQQSIWYKLHIDLPLLLGLLTLMALSMVVLYSASGQDLDSSCASWCAAPWPSV